MSSALLPGPAESSPEKKSAERWLEIGWTTWLVQYAWLDHWLDFRAYQVVGAESGDPDAKKLFEGTDDFDNYVTDLKEARCLSGHVKWDGCCEFTWPDESMHLCGRDGVENFSKLLLAIHQIASEVMPKFDRECAGYEPKK